jgi:hypothetical protein
MGRWSQMRRKVAGCAKVILKYPTGTGGIIQRNKITLNQMET